MGDEETSPRRKWIAGWRGGGRVRSGSASFVCLWALVAAACATPAPDHLQETEQLRPGARFRLESVLEPEGRAEEVDAARLLREAVEAELAAAGVQWSGNASEDHYDLRLQILEYEPGNAFKRWLLPGYGATVLTVHGAVIDPASGASAATVDHRRSVVMGGAYTIGAWRTVFRSLARDIAHELAAQSRGRGFFVSLDPWASRDIDVPRSPSPRRFELGRVEDVRPDRGRVGERFAAFGVSMGDIDLARDVAGFIRETLSDDLRAAGHAIAEPNEAADARIDVEVRRFWVRTDTTPLYWDVVAEIELALTLTPSTIGATPQTASSTCETRKRTYVWPTRRIVAQTLDACLMRLIPGVRNDPMWLAAGEARARVDHEIDRLVRGPSSPSRLGRAISGLPTAASSPHRERIRSVRTSRGYGENALTQ